MGLRELCPLASIGPVVYRRKCLKMLTYNTHTHTYGQQRLAYPISSPLRKTGWLLESGRQYEAPFNFGKVLIHQPNL